MTQNDTLTNLNVAPTDAIDLTGVDRAALARLDLDTISVPDLAYWLYDHGAAHLSTMECIELAERLTRRRFIIGAGGLLGAAALGACGAGEQAAAPTRTTGATRTITDGLGRNVEIPANPQRIVALHDAGILLPLLELGVRPVGSASVTTEDGETIFRATQGYDTEGIVPVGWDPVNLEVITELQPDLLIAQGDLDSMPDLIEEIAPVIYLNRFNRDHLDALVQLADIVGMADEAEDRRAELEAKIENINSALGGMEETTVSIMFWGGDGTFRPSLGYAMWDTIFNEIPFARPEAAEAWDRIEDGPFSVEVLPEFSGDVIILEIFNEAAVFPTVEEFEADPLASTLPAVQAGQVYTINGLDVYGFSWAGSNVTVDLIGEILTSEDLNRDLVEE